jgi:hypothetical protein
MFYCHIRSGETSRRSPRHSASLGTRRQNQAAAGLLAIFAATTSLIFTPILSTLRLRLRVRPWLTRVYQAMTKKKIWSGKSKFWKAIVQRKDGLSSLLPTLALA